MEREHEVVQRLEKLDMKWPSERVKPGGIFHLPKVKYSQETHDLIKLLMEEQKMTMFQRNKMNYYLRNGEPLPPPQPPKQMTEAQLKMQEYEMIIRERAHRKRTLEDIINSGAYEFEKFIPKNLLRESSEKQKKKLQEKMSGQKIITELDNVKISNKYKHRKEPASIPNTHRQIIELVDEIYERADWLNDMEQLGEGKKYRAMIQSQIAEKLQHIKRLEKKHKCNDEKCETRSASSIQTDALLNFH